jgi:hypothetical protein
MKGLNVQKRRMIVAVATFSESDCDDGPDERRFINKILVSHVDPSGSLCDRYSLFIEQITMIGYALHDQRIQMLSIAHKPCKKNFNCLTAWVGLTDQGVKQGRECNMNQLKFEERVGLGEDTFKYSKCISRGRERITHSGDCEST